VYDVAAQPVTINFFYTERVPLQATIHISPRQGYVSSTADLIRRSVALFINQLGHGRPIFRAWLSAPASLSGETAVEATGFSQTPRSGRAERYVLRAILMGRASGAAGANDVPLRFMEAAPIAPEDIGIGLV